MTVTLTKYPTALLNKIGSYVCQAVIYIQQQQSELLLDKYRSISWRDNSNQARLKAKLIEAISNAQDWESLVERIEVFIKALLVPKSTNPPILIKLEEKIRQLNPNVSELNSSSHREDVKSTTKESTVQTVAANPSNHQNFQIKTTELDGSENQQEIKTTELDPKESLATKNESNGSENQQEIKTTELDTKESLSITNELNGSENQQEIKTTELDAKESLATTNELNGSENQQEINSTEQEASDKAENKQQTGIAVLLLDAENIQIRPETEKFLTTVCNNPIQIKIAFANWQSMGKKDIEFHNRGYNLIHVPRGKDNADGKMIAFGSIIDEYYPKAKEVLVCSSDRVMTNLCNHLQQKGLDVYQISQENSNLSIFNGKTNETQTHTILPSIEQVLSQMKEIIKEQEAQTSKQWFKLSKICRLFKDKYSFGINKVVSHHLPGQTVKNIFVNKPEFVIHQISEDPESYVTLFKMPTQENLEPKILTFENKSSLEQALVKIIIQLVGKIPSNYIPINTVGERFNKQYGKGITKILKELNMSGNFVNFLQSCHFVELKKTGNMWQVAIK